MEKDKLLQKERLTVKEVAEIFGVANGTVHRWVRNGKLKATKMRTVGQFERWEVPIEEVSRLINDATIIVKGKDVK